MASSFFAASTKSPRTVQHMHPFGSSIMSSFSLVAINWLSMPTAPNSFTMTPILRPCSEVSMWLTNVVFPEPSAPVTIVTGIFMWLGQRTNFINSMPNYWFMNEVVVLSVGGSLINPGEIQVGFLKKLKAFIQKSSFKFILVCGGGINARLYPNAAKQFGVSNKNRDWIGIQATLLNAELLRHIFNAPSVQQAPKKVRFSKVLVAAGWLPGCSTDYDAVLWAEKFNAKYVFNLSNTDYVYTRDPRKFKDAKPLKCISWRDYKKLITSKWSAGLSTPFDPVASRAAEKFKISAVCVNGLKLGELNKFLKNKSFVGTVIG